jgi:hypothetical protein
MRFLSLLVIVSSLISIQSSEASQPDEQFCNEWAKYIDAFDMVSPSKKELPYSMDKFNGDIVKGGMAFGEEIVFVPEPSATLLKSWPTPNFSTVMKEQMSKYYDARKTYNKKVSELYKEKGNNQAIKLLRDGLFKSDENQIVELAKDIQKTVKGKGNDDIIKNCFGAYQKLSHARIKESNLQEYKSGVVIRSLNDDLQNCQMGSKITDTNRYNIKTVEEIVDQVFKKEESANGVQK